MQQRRVIFKLILLVSSRVHIKLICDQKFFPLAVSDDIKIINYFVLKKLQF